jgi:hypothetical protein
MYSMAMASSALATFRGSEQGSVNVALAKTRWTSYPYELEASRLKISVGLGWTQLLAANNKYWLMCKDEIIRRSRNSRSTDFHASHKFLVCGMKERRGLLGHETGRATLWRVAPVIALG